MTLNASYTLRGVAKTGLLAAALAAFATLAPAASPNDAKSPKSKLWIDVGASERIDFAGRLHMLSQRIAASSCNLEAGVETEISRGLLAGSTLELKRIMQALRYGNPRMKIIGEEDNPRILSVFNGIETQWTPVNLTITSVLEQGGSQQDFEVISRWNEPFLEASKLLVSEIAAEYSDPADLLQRDAILVDIAGRQRMRTQLILKQACAIWKDGGTQAEKDALFDTIQMFERTLTALRYGSEDAGFTAAPTPELEAALSTLAREWDKTKLSLATVAQGRALSDAAKGELYLTLNEMLIQSGGIVSQYARFSKNIF